MRRSKWWFPLFVGPCLLAFAIVVLIPMITGIYYSFTDWNGIGQTAKWVGIQNYIDIFLKDKAFFNVFLFTAKFAAISVLTINVIGFLLALLVTRGLKGSSALRSVFFMPNLIGGLILGFVWQFIFVKAFNAVDFAKVIDFVTVKFGHIAGQLLGTVLVDDSFFKGWLSDTHTGFWGLVILMSWQMSGYMMVIYIAAIESIPESMNEAALIDGANAFQRLWNITIPLVAPAFTVGVFLALSNSFKLFDQNLALTQGGPNNSTEMLALNIYKTAFTFNKLGTAQAKAVIFLIAVAAISITQIYYSKRREVEL